MLGEDLDDKLIRTTPQLRSYIPHVAAPVNVDSVHSFLEKIEYLRESRSVSKNELFATVYDS